MSPQASDLDGEIDLSTCNNVTEYQAQRNYGFQIHVCDLAFDTIFLNIFLFKARFIYWNSFGSFCMFRRWRESILCQP